jgi:hypothetical protein
MAIRRAGTSSSHLRLTNAGVYPSSDALRLICGKDHGCRVAKFREGADEAVRLATDLHVVRSRRSRFEQFVCEGSCNRIYLFQVYRQTSRVA